MVRQKDSRRGPDSTRCGKTGNPKRNGMETSRHLRTAWKLFAASPILYLLMGAALAYGSLFTLGLLAGPLIGGFVNVGLVHHRTGRPPGFADLTSAVQNLGNLLLLSLLFLISWAGIGVVLPVLMAILWWAYIPLFILLAALATWWMHVPVLIVDQRKSLWGAMGASRARVTADGGFLPHLGFLVCIFLLPPTLIFGLSRAFPSSYLLHFIVCPIQFLALASAYEDDFGNKPDAMNFLGDTERGTFR